MAPPSGFDVYYAEYFQLVADRFTDATDPLDVTDPVAVSGLADNWALHKFELYQEYLALETDEERNAMRTAHGVSLRKDFPGLGVIKRVAAAVQKDVLGQYPWGKDLHPRTFFADCSARYHAGQVKKRACGRFKYQVSPVLEWARDIISAAPEQRARWEDVALALLIVTGLRISNILQPFVDRFIGTPTQHFDTIEVVGIAKKREEQTDIYKVLAPASDICDKLDALHAAWPNVSFHNNPKEASQVNDRMHQIPVLKDFADAYQQHFNLPMRVTSGVFRKLYNGILLVIEGSQFSLIDTGINLCHSVKHLPAAAFYDLLAISLERDEEDENVPMNTPSPEPARKRQRTL